jgi:transcription antitermination factor NusG
MNVEEFAIPAHQWYAVRVKSRAEKMVAMMMHNKGFEAFSPLYQCRRQWSDRFKSMEVPLFPGYVFCQLNLGQRLPILIIPGVLHFVGIGKVPVPIAEGEIAAIQTAARSGLSAEPWQFLEVGQRVRLEQGPLAGVEGFLVEIRKQHRLVVSVTLLQRSVAVEIQRDWVQPLDASGSKIMIPFSPQATAATPCF